MRNYGEISVGPGDYYLCGSVYGIQILETPKSDGGVGTP